MATKNAKGNTNIKSVVEFCVMVKHGVVTRTTSGYAYCPRTHFGGGTVKWFDDSKLLKK